MKVGLFGSKMSGKTIIFNSLTGQSIAAGMPEVNRSVVNVPDMRIDRLKEIFNPKKTVYAKIEFVDVPGFGKSPDKKVDNVILDALNGCDIFFITLNYFDFDKMMTDKEPDPVRDYESLISDMVIRDLIIVENKLERLIKSKKTIESEAELKLFKKLKEEFENEKPITDIELESDELKIMSGYGFLTGRKQLVVINISEDKVGEEEKLAEEFKGKFPYEPIFIAASLEAEISTLPDSEQVDFAQEMGLKEPGRNILIKSAYKELDLISFFTMGEDEVRAWTIKKGTPAKVAAGTIHSDLERGFIKGNIVTWDDFNVCGSEAVAKEEKKYRLEGATYEMKDGDIMEVRFNV